MTIYPLSITKSKFLLFFLFLLLPATLYAQENNTAHWPKGSAMHTALIWKEKHDYFLNQLHMHHNRLLQVTSSIPDNDLIVNTITTQHQAWLEYYQTECHLIGNLSDAGGSWPSAYTMQCMANLTDKRFRRVSAALRCIQKVPADKRRYHQQRCFYQLAPMALHE